MTGNGRRLRCAIYTRVSTEHGLEQDFNSLDAQREAAEDQLDAPADTPPPRDHLVQPHTGHPPDPG